MNNHLAVVSGVCGFLGRHVAAVLQELGYKVVGIGTNSTENAPSGRLSRYVQMRLPDAALESLLAEVKADLFVHCAGRASVVASMAAPEDDFDSGPAITFAVLNSLRRVRPTCKFVFMSSAAVYGEPRPETFPVKESEPVKAMSPYGWHKSISEQLCVEFSTVYSMATASLRVFSAYGPGIRRQVLWDICDQILTKRELVLQGTGDESRDFIHARDVARAVAIIAEKAPMRGERFNVAAGREVTIRELANLLCCSLKFNGEAQFSGQLPRGVPRNWHADISKLQAIGFRPEVTLEAGVESFAHWCKAEILGF